MPERRDISFKHLICIGRVRNQMLDYIPMIKRNINQLRQYISEEWLLFHRPGHIPMLLSIQLCCHSDSERMHCTGFSKRIHRSVQLISVCLSSANQINPQLAYASVDLSPKLPGGGGKASSTTPLIPQLALFLQLTASVKERAQTHN